ncbi:Sortase family protein [Nocardioides scoriae]|uniref:Sortase family protein n=1 Tax=Nocardioides scoriae TaxID=642780 RepID=A0A1H1LJQ0_9ACTN|nr:class F sortase [Nocardioides scoriae]SDR74552.1 Sortase family protein [Nocardioides scoriae]
MTRLRPGLVALLGLVVVAAVALVLLVTHRPATTAPVPDSPVAARAEPPASTSASEDLLVTPERSGDAAPVRVRIPSLDVSSTLEELRTDRRGQLEAPRAWQQAGWFADGTAPGAPGPAVIAGHVDSPDGPAVFARLSDLRPGDTIEVDQADGATVRFQVDRTQVVPKDGFPTRDVYGPTPDAQLRLITCDGPYVESAGGYQDNFVVYASEVTA